MCSKTSQLAEALHLLHEPPEDDSHSEEWLSWDLKPERSQKDGGARFGCRIDGDDKEPPLVVNLWSKLQSSTGSWQMTASHYALKLNVTMRAARQAASYAAQAAGAGGGLARL